MTESEMADLLIRRERVHARMRQALKDLCARTRQLLVDGGPGCENEVYEASDLCGSCSSCLANRALKAAEAELAGPVAKVLDTVGAP